MQRDPDENLVVIFKIIATPNDKKTKETGRAIFDDEEICEIKWPGGKDIKHFPATAFCRWVDDPFTGMQTKQSYAERFPRQYRQFKERQQQTTSGTPLDYAPFLTDARRAELRALNVYTIEALAAIEGNELKNLGPGGRDMKNKAIEFIEEARSSAPNKRMEAELEALRAQNAVLQDDLTLLKSARDRADAEFEDMSDEQLRDYIATQTGKAPQGTPNRKTLKRMAAAATPQDKVA